MNSETISACWKIWFYLKLESPPAWTQETYRPRRIKYSICCLVPGGTPAGGIPIPPGGGYPTSDNPHQTWLGGPHLGYPPSDLTRGYPIPTGGYPILGTPIRPSGGYPTLHSRPHQTWPGGTPSLLEEGYPSWLPPVRPLGVVPHLGYPLSDLAGGGLPISARGYPTLGTPGCTWPGYPPAGPGWGTPRWTRLGIPPDWTDRQTRVKT